MEMLREAMRQTVISMGFHLAPECDRADMASRMAEGLMSEPSELRSDVLEMGIDERRLATMLLEAIEAATYPPAPN
jgi:hypothetical protein